MTKPRTYHSQFEQLILEQGRINNSLHNDNLDKDGKRELEKKQKQLELETKQFFYDLDMMVDEQEEEIKYFLKTLQIRRTNSIKEGELSEIDKLKEVIKMELEFGLIGMVKTEYHFEDININTIKFAEDLEKLKGKYKVYDSSPQIDEYRLNELTDNLSKGVNNFNVENAWNSIINSTYGFKANILDALNSQGQVEKRHEDIADRVNRSYLRRINDLDEKDSELRKRLKKSDEMITDLKHDIYEYDMRIKEMVLYDQPKKSTFKKMLPVTLAFILGGAITAGGCYFIDQINDNNVQPQRYNQQIKIDLENN